MQYDSRHHRHQRQEHCGKNIQDNRSILNKIRHIQEIGKKLNILSKKHSTTDHIDDLVKIPLRAKWYD